MASTPSSPGGGPVTGRDPDAERRYREVANEKELGEFWNKAKPTRAPYSAGEVLCRGATFYPKFTEFLEKGGVGKFKNSVVVSMRINQCHALDELRGLFTVGYYLDTAFWVPKFDKEFYDTNNKATVGQFGRYEPVINFPDTMSSKFLGRTTTFSKDPKCQRHEVQLGQNKETSSKLKKGKRLNLTEGRKEGEQVKFFVHEPTAHWPRMWRALVTDEELVAVANGYGDPKAGPAPLPVSAAPKEGIARRMTRKISITLGREPPPPTAIEKAKASVLKAFRLHKHEVPNAAKCAMALRTKFASIDAERDRNLAHPDEGICFLTHEIEATCVEHFELEEFPYDTQSLTIKIKFEKGFDDPLGRFIVPLCIDKAFFCTSRITPLVEWTIAKNLDWQVETGAGGNSSRDGGKQRLLARIIVCRKSYYYTLHYILMAWSITTVVFFNFTVDGTDVSTRFTGVLTIMLTVVAFNYVCAGKIPKVPYSTILDGFLIADHCVILVVLMVVTYYSYLAQHPGTTLVIYYEGAHPEDERAVGGLLFLGWMLGNAFVAADTIGKVHGIRKTLETDEQLEFLSFKSQIQNSRIRDVKKKGAVVKDPGPTLFKRLFGSNKAMRGARQKTVMDRVESCGLECTGADKAGFFYDCGDKGKLVHHAAAALELWEEEKERAAAKKAAGAASGAAEAKSSGGDDDNGSPRTPKEPKAAGPGATL